MNTPALAKKHTCLLFLLTWVSCSKQ